MGVRGDLDLEMAEWREAGDDDHPYGPWGGGSKASGGHAGGGGGKPSEFVKPDNWDDLTVEQKVALHNAYLEEQTGPAGPHKTALVGKQYGDERPEMGVAVKDDVTGHHALASYNDKDGSIELSPSLTKAKPGDDYHEYSRRQVFAHEVGHGFESQFDLTDPKMTEGLGRFDASAPTNDRFVVSPGSGRGNLGRRTYKNASEAAAESFAEYVIDPGNMPSNAKAWVEKRLASKPNWKQSVDSLRGNSDPAHWARLGVFK